RIRPFDPASPQAGNRHDADAMPPPDAPGAGSNRWIGCVVHCAYDGTLAQISLAIGPRIRITGLADPEAPGGGLAPGDRAEAWFQAAGVLIGTVDWPGASRPPTQAFRPAGPARPGPGFLHGRCERPRRPGPGRRPDHA